MAVPPEPAPAKPRGLVRLLAAVLFVLFLVILTEGFFAAYFFLRDGRWLWPTQRWAAQENLFIGDLTSGTCRYIDTLFPHPYLVSVHTANPPCPTEFTNAQGLFGRDFPLRRDPDTFAILLTGGSVAAHMGQTKSNGPLFLEEALNACYKAPKGLRFQVYNGADGGWRQPRQAIISLLYGDAVDAVVTLDGFNELQYLSLMRLEMPDANFELLNPLALRSSRGVAASVISNQVQIMVSQSPARYSFTAYFFVDRLRAWLTSVAYAGIGERKTSLVSLFALPADWTSEQRSAFNIDQYRKYMRIIDADAKVQGARAAFFIQPAPAIGKELTSEEKKVVGSLAYGPLYAKLADALLETRVDGLNVFSLLDVFRGTADTVYGDSIHFTWDPKTLDSRGNRIVAAAMAERLAAIWSLERTCR
ncbi:MAG: hypothetical protein NVSMB26_17290 [Beijerinckiaceae bacterium]